MEELFNHNKSYFGLDIGRETLKVAELKGGSAVVSVYGFNEIKIPEGSLTAEGIKDKEQIAEAIRSACKGAYPHPITNKWTVSALSDSVVFTKTIKLPKMPVLEIEKAIPHETAESFPLPAEEIYFDWQILSSHHLNNKGGGNSKFKKDKKNVDENESISGIDVLLVAAPKKLVDDYIEIINMAGLDIVRLETKPIALSRLINFIDGKDKFFLTVDIGAGITGLSIYDNDSIRFTGTVAVGGQAIKKDKEKISEIIEEVEHLIKYYQTRMENGHTNLESIYLAGGGANIASIGAKISEALKIKVNKIDPDNKIRFPKNTKFDPKFTTALGLALHSRND